MEDYNSKYSGEEVDGLLDEIGNKVDKVEGKQLSTEDFTTILKQKLDGLSNYDDTTISQAVAKLRTDLDALVSGDTTTAIKTFNEVIAFLDGISDTEDLSGIIASIEQQIAGKMDKVTLATVATTGSYNDLADKPTIPSDDSVVHKTGAETISGAKTFNSGVNFLGSGDSNAITLSTNTRINVNGTNKTVLGFGTGTFYINHADYKLLLRGKDTRPTYNSAEMALASDVNGKYSKPSTGIPKTDLASSVQTSLNNADSSIQAVDTGDVLDDVAVEYVTKTYFDSVVGDINSVLESIIGGTSEEITFYIDDGAGVTSMNASPNMTFGEFVNSEYANQNSMFTNFRLFNIGSYNGVTFYHEDAMSDLVLYKDNNIFNNVADSDVIENSKTYYAS